MARAGQDSDVWPVVLLLFAVVVPAVCLLWFMSAAMRNERFAARQKLAEAYRGQLSACRERLEQSWNDTAIALDKLAATTPASAAFARCVESGLADSIIIFDERGRITYPNLAVAPKADPDLQPRWAEASQLEYFHKNLIAAVAHYGALAKESTNVNMAAHALQAEARCLVQAGQTNAMVQLINERLGNEQYDHAVDSQGRLIVANAELMVLELSTNRSSAEFQATAQNLKRRLVDYQNSALASPQRRFLMKELQKLSPDKIGFPTLAAEDLAAHVCESRPGLSGNSALARAPLPDLWEFATPSQRGLALVRSETILARLGALAGGSLSQGASLTLLPPGVTDTAFVSLPAGEKFPEWRLALSLKDQKLFETATERRIETYLWAGILVVAAVGVLTLLALRVLRRRVALARLKNDLAATVSHELKTPLASMRVLVDTLLAAEKLDEPRTREYLELIAQENERLSRLIQNFLTFSRMERKKHTFQFKPVSAHKIIDAAASAVRERFDKESCQFEVHTEPLMPDLLADEDALTTALINLLDNAYKYSQGSRRIILSARAENRNILFSVQDNGIGIPPRETKRIFQHFYQVDQSLSRNQSGCGLGLSIVQFIITAHSGSVSAESQPNCGSTFTISIPAASNPLHVQREALA